LKETVGLGELGREQPDRRQVQIPAAQSLQDLRMTPRRSSRLDPFVGNPFGEMEHSPAVREHRGAAFFEIELPRVDLGQVNEQLGLDRIAAPHEFAHAREQPGTREPSEHLRHGSTSLEDGVRSIVSIT